MNKLQIKSHFPQESSILNVTCLPLFVEWGGIVGIYSSGGKSRQKAWIPPNGDYTIACKIVEYSIFLNGSQTIKVSAQRHPWLILLDRLSKKNTQWQLFSFLCNDFTKMSCLRSKYFFFWVQNKTSRVDYSIQISGRTLSKRKSNLEVKRLLGKVLNNKSDSQKRICLGVKNSKHPSTQRNSNVYYI